MKKITIIFTLIALATSFASAKSYYQKGYYKKSTGTYVEPHLKTTPNKTKFDNYGCIYKNKCY